MMEVGKVLWEDCNIPGETQKAKYSYAWPEIRGDAYIQISITYKADLPVDKIVSTNEMWRYKRNVLKVDCQTDSLILQRAKTLIDEAHRVLQRDRRNDR
ncbi:Hypothetical protein NTJ_02743 [Nesidiocoris tenuis]|uniref:Uncharacterized protein n=2 Tax=Nesidiocoris tenuis TaxID=355587 RepID=A0ABN7ACA9_9HEMI|nr:Hypothetical protein NTJ_02743 [Nesidiocoris tenuis]